MYHKHCENLKLLNRAIKLTQRDLRKYISTEKEYQEIIYTRILTQLIANWIEVRILKLAYEPSAFSQNEKELIIESSTLKDKWITALNISICKAYSLNYTNQCNEIENRLSFTPRTKYIELLKLIKNDLLKSLQVRNRIAHGQWKYAFNNDLTQFNQELTSDIHKENIVKLQLKIKLFKSLSKIIHDLSVSPDTFKRDFDSHFSKIEQQKNNLHNRNYEKYKKHMIAKYQRGIEKRRENLSQ